MKEILWDRRRFLKAAALGTFLFLARPSFAAEEVLKEENEGKLRLYNTRTGERLDVAFRNPSGAYDLEALSKIDSIMRCHYTRKTVEMDTRVIEYLSSLDRKLGGGNEIHIVSGYRSPEYNKILRIKSKNVARRSLHMFGRAVDIRIPGVSIKKLKEIALQMRFGGVGYYPKKNFLHLDSGRFRFW